MTKDNVLFVSALQSYSIVVPKVADWTGQKARYIRNRGLDDGYYRKLLTDYLQKYGQATRKDIDDLLLSKMPEILKPEQKAHKVRNLVQVMRREGLIHREGPKTTAVWKTGPGAASSA
jgi:ATP-dependent DNA helicase RecG